MAGWLHRFTSIMERTMFCFYRSCCLFWVWISFPCLQCFCQKHHLGTYIIAYQGIPHSFWPRNSLHSRWSEAMGPISGNSLVCCALHYHGAVGLTVWQNCLFGKSQLGGNIVPARWQQFAGVGQDFPEAIYALNQQPIYYSLSPLARTYRTKKMVLFKGWKWNSHHWQLPSEPLANFGFLFLWPYASQAFLFPWPYASQA